MSPPAVFIEALINGGRWLHNWLGEFGPGSDFVVLEVAGSLPERRPRSQGVRGWVQRRFGVPQDSLADWRERLTVLAADPRVKGVILTIDDLQAGFPALESLRRSLQNFRASGKRLIAYLVLANLRGYYLASAAEAIVAPESAELSLHGLRTEATFLRGAFDHLGILPQFHHIAEYKSAANRFLYSSMPTPQREMLSSLLENIYEELLSAIAAARRQPESGIAQALDRGLLSATEAQERGLLDHVAFGDQLPTWLSQNGRPARIHPWDRARQRVRLPYRWRTSTHQAIALVPLVGTIVPGESRDLPMPLPFLGRQLVGHETVSRALRRAEDIPSIKAIVFYVDSPGGSAIASDLIWREVIRLQERKPVVVCMGNIAGSGGYYVACGARHIVAGATTLTGSIGVIAGKVNLRGLLEKAGVRHEIVSRGATASMPSAFASYTEAEWEILQRWMEEIYQRFKRRVAAGRGQPLEAVETIARGRVWTGRQALQHGLIDEIGDFETAVRQAKRLAGIQVDADVPVVSIQLRKAIAWPAAGPAAWGVALRSVRRLLNEQALVLVPFETTP
jgi:protease-4